jgi:hypothetical protein
MTAVARPLEGDDVVSVSALRRIPAPFLAGLAGCLAVVLAIGPWPVGVFQDDGLYVILAKSLATGEGYRFLNLPGAPNATHYPPGYPAFLAVLWKLYPDFPGNVTLFKFANAALIGLATALVCRFAMTRMALGSGAALAAAILFTACTPVLLLSVMVMSEPLFLAVLLASLLLAERAADTPTVRNVVVAAMAGALLAHVRTLGLLVIPALAIVLLMRRQWRAASVAVATGAAAMGPWQLWVRNHAHEVPALFSGKYGDYFGWWSEAVRADGTGFLWGTAMHNVRALAAYGLEATASGGFPTVVRYGAVAALAALLIGGLFRLATRAPVTASFVAAYLGVVLVWPFSPPRFLFGIWPLIGMACVMSAQWVAGGARGAPTAPRRLSRMVGALPAALLLAGYLTYNWLAVTGSAWDQLQKGVADRAQPLAEWTVRHAPADAVLATDDDALMYLYTGRHAIPTGRFTPQEYLRPQTPAFAVESLREILRTYPVDYVLASSEYGMYAVRGLVTAGPPELGIVSVLNVGAVFAPVTHKAP